jgi:hypothetical protein
MMWPSICIHGRNTVVHGDEYRVMDSPRANIEIGNAEGLRVNARVNHLGLGQPVECVDIGVARPECGFRVIQTGASGIVSLGQDLHGMGRMVFAG